MQQTTPRINEEKLHGFINQVITDMAACSAGFMTHLGHRLGLYKAMAGAGHLSADAVADRAGCGRRYVREWLNSQAAGGYVEYHATDDSYHLPPEQALVLADEQGNCFFPPALEVSASMWRGEQRLLDAVRSGEGVPWGDHDGRLFCGIAAFYRSGYGANLVQHWLPALDGVVPRLEHGALVADIGCGHGHSTILMARAFPRSRFQGFDNHPASIAAARENARSAGVEDRVSFHTLAIRDIPTAGFDLACFFDCLHDLGDPIGAARHVATTLAPGGSVMLVEPFAGDSVEDNLHTIGRLFYAGSTVFCCAHSLSEDVGLALGAQAGGKRLAQVFREAGYGHFRHALQTPVNLICEARILPT